MTLHANYVQLHQTYLNICQINTQVKITIIGFNISATIYCTFTLLGGFYMGLISCILQVSKALGATQTTVFRVHHPKGDFNELFCSSELLIHVILERDVCAKFENNGQQSHFTVPWLTLTVTVIRIAHLSYFKYYVNQGHPRLSGSPDTIWDFLETYLQQSPLLCVLRYFMKSSQIQTT